MLAQVIFGPRKEGLVVDKPGMGFGKELQLGLWQVVIVIQVVGRNGLDVLLCAMAGFVGILRKIGAGDIGRRAAPTPLRKAEQRRTTARMATSAPSRASCRRRLP